MLHERSTTVSTPLVVAQEQLGRVVDRGSPPGGRSRRPGPRRSGRAKWRARSTEWVPLSTRTPPPLTAGSQFHRAGHVDARREGVLDQAHVAEAPAAHEVARPVHVVAEAELRGHREQHAGPLGGVDHLAAPRGGRRRAASRTARRRRGRRRAAATSGWVAGGVQSTTASSAVDRGQLGRVGEGRAAEAVGHGCRPRRRRTSATPTAMRRRRRAAAGRRRPWRCRRRRRCRAGPGPSRWRSAALTPTPACRRPR